MVSSLPCVLIVVNMLSMFNIETISRRTKGKDPAPSYQVLDYTACLHLVYEGEDLEQNPLYGHTSAEPEEEVGQVEGPVVFCQGANVEHHVRGAEG